MHFGQVICHISWRQASTWFTISRRWAESCLRRPSMLVGELEMKSWKLMERRYGVCDGKHRISWIDVGKLCLLISYYELFDNVCWLSPVFSNKKPSIPPICELCRPLVQQEWKLAGSVQSCNTKCGTPCRGTEEASGELQGAAVGCAWWIAWHDPIDQQGPFLGLVQ